MSLNSIVLVRTEFKDRDHLFSAAMKNILSQATYGDDSNVIQESEASIDQVISNAKDDFVLSDFADLRNILGTFLFPSGYYIIKLRTRRELVG